LDCLFAAVNYIFQQCELQLEQLVAAWCRPLLKLNTKIKIKPCTNA
jgi:hypothetical protein